MLSNNKNSCEQDLKSKKRAFTASCATKYATDTFKTTSKTAIQKAAKAAPVSTTLPQNCSKIVESEKENNGLSREISKNTHISLEKRQKIVDDLRLP